MGVKKRKVGIIIGIVIGIIVGIFLWKNNVLMNEGNEEAQWKTSELQRAARLLDMMEEEKNLLFSPVSLDMTLGMVAEGADGKTLESLKKFLKSDDYSMDALQYMNSIEQHLNTSKSYGFNLYNSFWSSTEMNYKTEYQNKLETNFRADVYSVDFTDGETAQKINEWCAKRTKGQISCDIDKINAETSGIFLNVVYFNGEWEKPWEVVSGEFVNAIGEKKEIDVLRTLECSRYYENQNAVGFSKKYKDNYEFIGILPKKEGDFELAELDLDSFMKSASFDYNVEAQMPRINMKVKMEMIDVLKRYGMSDVFEEAADFSRMTEDDVAVTKILQACELTLDENKTTVSSTSAVIMEKGEELKEKKKVCLNRPFAFVILDTETQQIIYMGKYLNCS